MPHPPSRPDLGALPGARPGASLEDVEIELLLEGVYRHYGYDFRNYAISSLRRRLRFLVLSEGTKTISGLKEKVLHDPAALERLLLGLSVNVSAMFRDPSFYRAVRATVVPVLRTYPFVRIWHAGCATGEEVYSMAILLEEAGLYERCRIYATDINEVVLRRAREGIFPLKQMKAYTENYIRAGGTRAFSEYYTAQYDNAIFRPELKKNLVFAQHNLAMDGSFNEFHLIMCRNVMIYFNKALQERALDLFADSLVRRGFLCLGAKETLKGTTREGAFDEVDTLEKIYRKVRM
ncbi:MAG: protein-glutamate O-methyltransferase CheR [Chloroflexota bacterium]|nr:protein-glutamate O-methyltransferase CheR [Chloroflexota bacterium]